MRRRVLPVSNRRATRPGGRRYTDPAPEHKVSLDPPARWMFGIVIACTLAVAAGAVYAAGWFRL